MPCNPLDITLPIPTGPSGTPLPSFGLPFALPVPNLTKGIDGFPEDLLSLLDQLQFLVPSGALKPQLSLNSGKDVLDAILKLLDQFLPILMIYKLILPILNLILCLIECICALLKPLKLIRAVRRLFRHCIPQFLNLFPIFALIVMIISLLLLLLALIEYIIAQILKFIEDILLNLNALTKAFTDADENSILAIAEKLGTLLCIFQNIFVVLEVASIIFQVFKDILSQIFRIPPCKKGDNSSDDGCCTPDVCPAFISNGNYTRNTGSVQYLRALGLQPTSAIPGLPNFSTTVRNESWVIYDTQQTIEQEFINITDAFDVAPGSGTDFVFSPQNKSKPVFFPSETYNALTPPEQSAYTVDLRLFYNPLLWGRFDLTHPQLNKPRYIRLNSCVVTRPPTRTLTTNDGTKEIIQDGVLILAGGQGYEDDGYTLLTGYDVDGVTSISDQATLENFLHMPERFSSIGGIIPLPSDGYIFSDATYTFKPNYETLISKQIITIGCEPSVALNKDFINDAFGGDIGFKSQELSDIVNGQNGNVFPDPAGTRQCLETALASLRSNMTVQGVADFQTTALLCLNKLKNDTNSALSSIISLGVEPCNSDFTLEPSIQFTTRPIKVSVSLKERNGLSLVNNLPIDVAQNLAEKIKGYPTFGSVGQFSYDGYNLFVADLTSDITGNGEMTVSFDDNIFCINTIPDDNSIPPTHTLKTIPYQFIFSNTGAVSGDPSTGSGSDGQPRRDAGDVSREGNNGNQGI